MNDIEYIYSYLGLVPLSKETGDLEGDFRLNSDWLYGYFDSAIACLNGYPDTVKYSTMLGSLLWLLNLHE